MTQTPSSVFWDSRSDTGSWRLAMSYARKKHIPVINLSAYCQTVPEDTPEENGSH